MEPEVAPYQRCLIPNIPRDVQETVRDVINYGVIPLDILLASLSIIFNLLVLTAVLRTKSLRYPSLLLLCSLSITDLLWAVFSIFKDTVRLTQDDFCPSEVIVQSGKGFAGLCFISTIGNLAVISKDRHLAVAKPLWYRSHVTRSRVVKQATAIWLFSVMMSGMIQASVYFPIVSRPAQIIVSLFYVFCFIVMIYSYAGIFIASRHHRQTMREQHLSQMLATLRREKRLANTVGLILVVLCLTTLPALITPLVLANLGLSAGSRFLPFRPLYSVFNTLNGLLNPLLNFGRNEGVRRAVGGLIRPKFVGAAVQSHNTESRDGSQYNPSSAEQIVRAEIPLEHCSRPTHA